MSKVQQSNPQKLKSELPQLYELSNCELVQVYSRK